MKKIDQKVSSCEGLKIVDFIYAINIVIFQIKDSQRGGYFLKVEKHFMTGQNPFGYCKESWGLVIHICPTQWVVQALQWKWWIVIEFDAYNKIENDLHVELCT